MANKHLGEDGDLPKSRRILLRSVFGSVPGLTVDWSAVECRYDKFDHDALLGAQDCPNKQKTRRDGVDLWEWYKNAPEKFVRKERRVFQECD